jgi:uncharacterized membrane protein YeaQ/YmgE (transglycosylase-associated protein family)
LQIPYEAFSKSLSPKVKIHIMDVITWILFGLIVGIVANAIDPQPQSGGLLGALLLGVTGSLLGGFIANMALGETANGISLTSFAVAIAGSLALLVLGRALRRI